MTAAESLKCRSLVYFVSAIGSNAIKIGFTEDIDSRLRELSTGSPFELLPIAAIFGPATEEYRAHMQLKRHRIRGEWFNDCREVWEYIETHAHFILGRDAEPQYVPLTSDNEPFFDGKEAYHGVFIKSIAEALSSSDLSERQRTILSMRFGVGLQRSMTLEEVAAAFRITRERVRQIEAKSLAALKANKVFQELAAHG
jgi:hypothetical protein